MLPFYLKHMSTEIENDLKSNQKEDYTVGENQNKTKKDAK